MAFTNSRTKVYATASSDFSYVVYANGASVFSGKFCVDSYGMYDIDITEILRPYVHAEEISNLSGGSGPTPATYSVTGYGATITSASGTLKYLNDYATDSIPASLSAKDWGVEKIPGQYYFSYASQGAWAGSQYGSYANTCQYNAEIIFTDVYGMPQGVPVRAINSAETEWSGNARVQDYQSSRHRVNHLYAEKTLSWTCYTPNIRQKDRALLARWLGQAEWVYLYDIEAAKLIPCRTPAVAAGNAEYDKLTISLIAEY